MRPSTSSSTSTAASSVAAAPDPRPATLQHKPSASRGPIGTSGVTRAWLAVRGFGVIVAAAGDGGCHGKERLYLSTILSPNKGRLGLQAARSAVRINSATRSPIIIVGMLVFALTIVGITEASATRTPSTP
jgi:hypothetical protein